MLLVLVLCFPIPVPILGGKVDVGQRALNFSSASENVADRISNVYFWLKRHPSQPPPWPATRYPLPWVQQNRGRHRGDDVFRILEKSLPCGLFSCLAGERSKSVVVACHADTVTRHPLRAVFVAFMIEDYPCFRPISERFKMKLVSLEFGVGLKLRINFALPAPAWRECLPAAAQARLERTAPSPFSSQSLAWRAWAIACTNEGTDLPMPLSPSCSGVKLLGQIFQIRGLYGSHSVHCPEDCFVQAKSRTAARLSSTSARRAFLK